LVPQIEMKEIAAPVSRTVLFLPQCCFVLFLVLRKRALPAD
jgi:hypothetical protein